MAFALGVVAVVAGAASAFLWGWVGVCLAEEERRVMRVSSYLGTALLYLAVAAAFWAGRIS